MFQAARSNGKKSLDSSKVNYVWTLQTAVSGYGEGALLCASATVEELEGIAGAGEADVAGVRKFPYASVSSTSRTSTAKNAPSSMVG